LVDKAPEAFRTISEVADDLDLPQHVLRFWETRFQQIKPMKRGGGRRYYRPDDVDLLRGIRHLLYGEGYTIRGAQRILKDHGAKFVQNVWRAGAPQPARAAQAAETEIVEAPPARPLPPGARRGDADSAHRRLFGLLPSFLSTGLDEERLARSRSADTEPAISPSASAASAASAAEAARPPAALPADGLRKLQDTLRDLQECRRLLEAAVAADA
jgi:DNA-binding transcriptional MerR regulator